MNGDELARRAVNLAALGREPMAIELLDASFDDSDLGLEVAVAMAQRLIADPDSARVPYLTVDLNPVCASVTMPVVTEVLNLTHGGHLGGLHQIWHRLNQHIRQDTIKVLLAYGAFIARHPERN